MFSLILIYNYKIHLQSVDLDLKCGAKSLPRLLLTSNTGVINQAWILTDGIKIECPATSVFEVLYILMAAYYAWDLSYPKQYQLLGFLQCHILRDRKSDFFKSTAYVKFEKELL